MTDLIRSACLTHYAEVAHSVGLDPREMLRKVRLPISCLARPDLRIAVASVRRLLEASALRPASMNSVCEWPIAAACQTSDR